MNLYKRFFIALLSLLILSACENEIEVKPDVSELKMKKADSPQGFRARESSASYPEVVEFSASRSSAEGEIFEVLPGPAAINPDLNPTPFSNNTFTTTGEYLLQVKDVNEKDSPDSEDAVERVYIRFIANDGREFLIDKIDVIHKPEGSGDHTFFGGVGLNKIMHGNTGIGTGLVPKLLSYITLWGLTDLKDAKTGETVAENRLVHIMTSTGVRDENRNLITSTENDKTDHNLFNAVTHVILPPDPDPVPGTNHGFLHMMFRKPLLYNASRDWKLVFEVLPGPSAINPDLNPTPFSNRIAVGGGEYNIRAIDHSPKDSETSKDAVPELSLSFTRTNGETFVIENINIIHKEKGGGDHTFFGGVGFNKKMHGDTGIGTNLMPKLFSYITLWGIADLKNSEGVTLDSDRLVHIMVTSRARTEDLKLISNTKNDKTDHRPSKVEAHFIVPALPNDPVKGTGHGFFHVVFEEVNLTNPYGLSASSGN